jgi:DNA polymerase (family X)
MRAPHVETGVFQLSNAQIADQLAGLAQLLSAQKVNPYKIKAYRRAAATIRTLSESIADLVRQGEDLTQLAGIGSGINAAIREIVLKGTLGRLETLRAEASPEVSSLSDYPRLDPKRILRVYKKLGISSVAELRQNLENGRIEQSLGPRMAQHVRQGLAESHAMLLYHADELRETVEEFLLIKCPVKRVEVVGEYRRRREVIEQLSFVIETDDFAGVMSKLQRYGGHTPLLRAAENSALFALSSGILLQVEAVPKDEWGIALVAFTGSETHLQKLAATVGTLKSFKTQRRSFPTEELLYDAWGLQFIEPELREGNDEVELAAAHALPNLVAVSDIRGELHAHSTSSDGVHSIEQMANAGKSKGYEYIGITDHSKSLKIAHGVTEEDLWKQIRFIDRLNERDAGIRLLKSAEVDILADGSLDYSDDLLKELDYTVCSIHSRFGFGREQQTERLLRAMDNSHFTILGHATGRLLLKRPGYEIDMDRVIAHAKQNGRFFEINSSPDRLDLSAEQARLVNGAGIKIAITTDAHSTNELELLRCGINQARRAGLQKHSVLNSLCWEDLQRLFHR